MLDLVFAFSIAAALVDSQKSRTPRRALIIIVVATCALATAMIRNAWWDSEDVPGTAAAIQFGHGYEGTDEYTPANTDRYQLARKS